MDSEFCDTQEYVYKVHRFGIRKCKTTLFQRGYLVSSTCILFFKSSSQFLRDIVSPTDEIIVSLIGDRLDRVDECDLINAESYGFIYVLDWVHSWKQKSPSSCGYRNNCFQWKHLTKRFHEEDRLRLKHFVLK